MPPRKRKPRKSSRTIRKSNRKPRTRQPLGWLFVIAVIVFGLVWWISRPNPSDQTAKPEKHPREIAETSTPQPETEQPEVEQTPEEIKVKEAETSTEKGIYTALTKLHIAENAIKRKKTDESINFSIPIDPTISDLTFANMILKGEVERFQGTFVSGTEKKHRQYLTFSDNATQHKYVLELYYQRNPEADLTKDKILAIIVDDFGNAKGKLLDGFAHTNPAVCFAIMPDTPYANQALQAGREAHHECIIHVPMEPLKYPEENPGDDAIFVQLTSGEITRRMERFIKKLPGCIGINNHMGSLATADEPAMQTVMQTLHKHNMLFVDSRTTGSSIAYKIAQKNLVPALKRDIFLDEPDLSPTTMDKKLAECLTLSQTHPYVLAIIHCHTEAHLNYLNRFIAKAEQAGFELTPVSRLASYKLPVIP